MPNHDTEDRAAAYWNNMIPTQNTTQGELFQATVKPVQTTEVAEGGEAETTTRRQPLAL